MHICGLLVVLLFERASDGRWCVVCLCLIVSGTDVPACKLTVFPLALPRWGAVLNQVNYR